MSVYQDLLKKGDSDPLNHLWSACCHFYMGQVLASRLHCFLKFYAARAFDFQYKEAEEAALKGPDVKLRNRILFHVVCAGSVCVMHVCCAKLMFPHAALHAEPQAKR